MPMTEYTIRLSPIDIKRLSLVAHKEPEKLFSSPKQVEIALKAYLKTQVEAQAETIDEFMDAGLDSLSNPLKG